MPEGEEGGIVGDCETNDLSETTVLATETVEERPPEFGKAVRPTGSWFVCVPSLGVAADNGGGNIGNSSGTG